MKKLLVVLFVSLALIGPGSAQIKLVQNTAIDVAVGPFLDATDGVTAETALTISQADVRLKKNAAAWAQKTQTSSCTHEENGWYECSLDTTDTNTIGTLVLAVNEAGAVPVWIYFEVIPIASHDLLVGGDVSSTADITAAIHEDPVPGAYAAGTAGYVLGHVRRPTFVGTADSGTTTTIVDAALTQGDTDYWSGSMIVFTSGTMVGQARYITAFTPASDTLTFAPAVTQDTNTETYEIWPMLDYLRATVSGRTLDVATTGEAGADFSNINGTLDAAEIGADALTAAKIAVDAIGASEIAADAIGASELATDAIGDAEIATGAIAATAFAAGAIDAAAIATDAIGDAEIATGAIAATAFAAGAIDAAAIAADAIGASELATDAIGAAEIAANAIGAAEVADASIDRATLAVDTGLQTVRSNTAQAGASTTITLDASASATDDLYNNNAIYLTGGTGVGQSRIITDYVGSTKVATVNAAWATNPASDTTFAVIQQGLSPASSGLTAADVWAYVTRELTSGANLGTVSANVTGLTAGALADFFDTNSGTTYGAAVAGSVVKEMADNAGGSGLTLDGISDAVWDEQRGGHTTGGSFGQGVASVQVNVTGSVGSVTTVGSGAITAPSFASGALDSAALATSAVTEIQTGLINFQKNVTYSNFTFRMVDDTDGKTPETGLTVSCQVSKDGGSPASCTNSVSEISGGVGGLYKTNVAAADLNADEVYLTFTASGARRLDFKIRPQK